MRATAFIKQHLANFCANTSIHGFAYIAHTERRLIERLFWLLTIGTSFALTGVLINKLIIENQHNPTVIYTEQNIVPVTDIVFPSISLVPGLIPRTLVKIGFDYDSYKTKLQNGVYKIDDFLVFGLQRMQIASLMARDGFMAQFNVTIPTDDYVKHMRENFLEIWRSEKLREHERYVQPVV
jgi:hypothetical protein